MATPIPEAETVIVKRTFEAPREKVFQAWTDPQVMTRWFARKGEEFYCARLSQIALSGDPRLSAT